MLKETETEDTVVFFVTFLSLVAFQLGGPGPPGPPPGFAYAIKYGEIKIWDSISSEIRHSFFKVFKQK